MPTDLALGTRRARAAALLAMALPGSFYLYQGEELGLPEVEIPRERIEDPMHFRSGGVDPGRDGCRVPIPWSGDAPPYGFSATQVDTWLPQPVDWARYAADRQASDPDSMLTLYRAALRLRHEVVDLMTQPLTWLDLGGAVSNQVIAFRRGRTFASVTNLTCHRGRPPADRPDPAGQHDGGRRAATRGRDRLARAGLSQTPVSTQPSITC